MPTSSKAFHGDRRAFFRRVTSLAPPPEDDAAWREIEARAARFGIVPGTLVDAQGRALEASPMDSSPFMGEIMVASFQSAPRLWSPCNGQLLPISFNQSLYALLGTTYGGNGTTNFALPDLRGRVPLHFGTNAGSSYVMGQAAGATTHTLTLSQIPAHVHPVASASPATALDPANALYAPAASGALAFTTEAATGSWTTSQTGGSQAHDNMPPYLALNFFIAFEGIFPSQS